MGLINNFLLLKSPLSVRNPEKYNTSQKIQSYEKDRNYEEGKEQPIQQYNIPRNYEKRKEYLREKDNVSLNYKERNYQQVDLQFKPNSENKQEKIKKDAVKRKEIAKPNSLEVRNEYEFTRIKCSEDNNYKYYESKNIQIKREKEPITRVQKRGEILRQEISNSSKHSNTIASGANIDEEH